ncbi:ABC transporter ATP-binding protein [Clostridiaceae bacterium HSG29]|nr:ABC transporter ATP-binding protein [Clostridiaceae bacterium HSG29]
MGEIKVKALRGSSFEVMDGEFVVVLGPSGSGKSTLLNMIGGMDNPTEGSVKFYNADVTKYSEKQLTQYRRDEVGFVFQFYNLMASLTAKENVELATEICSNPLDIDMIMNDVGLSERAGHFPSQMSGGEQQRVAIARAVAKNPKILLCDEPTGALDYTTGKKILQLLVDVNKKYKKTVIVITHNAAIGDIADKVIKMRSGEVEEIIENKNPISPERVEW